LERPDTREFATHDPQGFLQSLEEYVILDEIQTVPHLFSYLQTIVDQDPRKGRFILTGSQNFLLSERISQSLAGRVALLTLLPMSLRDLQKAGHLPQNYETLLYQGGYPRIYADGVSPVDWYPNYIRTYVEKDIRMIKNITDLDTFERFLGLCAGRVGQLVNWSDLGRDCGISYQTAKSWMSLLQSSFIVFLLPPHFKNHGKRLVKSPKLYFYDIGLACSLLNIESAQQVTTHYLKGGLFESLILSELAKSFYNKGRHPKLTFWRDQVGHEIDCLIEQGNSTTPVEIKSGKTLSQDFFKELVYWEKTHHSKGYLIYGGEEEQKRTQATVIGWKDFLNEEYNLVP